MTTERPSRLAALRGWLAALCLSATTVFGADIPGELPIELLLSKEGASYQRLADEYRQLLEERCINNCATPPIRITHVSDWLPERKRRLLIAVGNDAALIAAPRHNAPTLFGLIPQETWKVLSDTYGKRLRDNDSAVFLDQPVARSMRLIKQILPEERSRVGVILGPGSLHLQTMLESEAPAAGLQLAVEKVSVWQEVGPAVQRLSKGVDVLLAIPDETVFNANTLYGILLTSYETRVPVVGYSAALARAGAMVSIYTSISDMAMQLAEHTRDFLLSGDRLPPSGPSGHFNIAVNRQVAHSLGYRLPDSRELRLRLSKPGGLDAATTAAK